MVHNNNIIYNIAQRYFHVKKTHFVANQQKDEYYRNRGDYPERIDTLGWPLKLGIFEILLEPPKALECNPQGLGRWVSRTVDS